MTENASGVSAVGTLSVMVVSCMLKPSRIMVPLSWLVSLVLLLSLASNAWSTDRLVPSQYGTIAAAVAAAVDGDSVIISPGTWTTAVVISGKCITLKGTNPNDDLVVANTIIQAPGGSAATITSTNSVQSYSEHTLISGLTITGPGDGVSIGAGSHQVEKCRIGANSGVGIRGQGGRLTILDCDVYQNVAGIVTDGTEIPAAMHNTIYSNTGTGFQISNSFPNTRVQSEYIHDNGGHGLVMDQGWAHANSIANNGSVGLAAGDCDITFNTVWNNEIGITLQKYTAREVRVSNNLSYGNHTAIPASRGGGIFCSLANGAQVKMSFNTFADNISPNGGGIYCEVADGCSLDIRNTIITGNSGYGIMRGSSTGTVGLSYCDVWGNSTNYYGITSKAGVGNLSVNPLYSTYMATQYRLQSTAGHFDIGPGWHIDALNSPCIDAGDPANDCVNELAPNGGRVNMGYDGGVAYASKTPDWPVIVTKSPVGSGAAANSVIKVGFNRPMDHAATQAAFSITPVVAGTFSWVGDEMRFTPSAVLPILKSYSVKVGTGARSAGGIYMALPKSWSFRTSNAPVVTAKSPTGTGVGLTSKIMVTFNVPMDKASAQSAFSITPLKAGAFAWVGNQMQFTPQNGLAADKLYKVVISGAKSAAGVAMATTVGWGFRTGAAAPVALAAVASSTAAGAEFVVQLAAAADVTVRVQNLSGREVAVLAPGTLAAGIHSLLWSGRSTRGTLVPPGQYLVRVRAQGTDGRETSVLTTLRLLR